MSSFKNVKDLCAKLESEFLAPTVEITVPVEEAPEGILDETKLFTPVSVTNVMDSEDIYVVVDAITGINGKLKFIDQKYYNDLLTNRFDSLDILGDLHEQLSSYDISNLKKAYYEITKHVSPVIQSKSQEVVNTEI